MLLPFIGSLSAALLTFRVLGRTGRKAGNSWLWNGKLICRPLELGRSFRWPLTHVKPSERCSNTCSKSRAMVRGGRYPVTCTFNSTFVKLTRPAQCQNGVVIATPIPQTSASCPSAVSRDHRLSPDHHDKGHYEGCQQSIQRDPERGKGSPEFIA